MDTLGLENGDELGTEDGNTLGIETVVVPVLRSAVRSPLRLT